jgi:hypothetical protein
MLISLVKGTVQRHDDQQRHGDDHWHSEYDSGS